MQRAYYAIQPCINITDSVTMLARRFDDSTGAGVYDGGDTARLCVKQIRFAHNLFVEEVQGNREPACYPLRAGTAIACPWLELDATIKVRFLSKSGYTLCLNLP